MNLSELIDRLIQIEVVDGDIPVRLDGDMHVEVSTVQVLQGPELELPKYVDIS